MSVNANNEEYLDSRSQCEWLFDQRCAMAFLAYQDHAEDKTTVDCPHCRKLMLEAMDPVRRDYLLERGLIEDLKKTT